MTEIVTAFGITGMLRHTWRREFRYPNSEDRFNHRDTLRDDEHAAPR